MTLSPGTANMIRSMINGTRILNETWVSFDPARFAS